MYKISYQSKLKRKPVLFSKDDTFFAEASSNIRKKDAIVEKLKN
jgi:hypothetical protein